MSKKEWLERLAFKREELLASVGGLSQVGWTTVEVLPGWTAKDVLAHVAAWETRVATLLPDLLADNGANIAGVEADVFNAEQVALRRGRILRELLDEMADSRRRIQEALTNAADGDLVLPRAVPWGQITIERWALQEIYEHDAEHAAQLRLWRTANPGVGRSLWDTRVDDMAAQRAGLFIACLGLDAGTLGSTPVGDDWTIKDLLAHAAFWDDLHTGRVELALAGREAAIVGEDVDERNAELFPQRRGWSFEQALQAALDSRQRYLQVFSAVSPEQLTRPLHLPWRETSIWEFAWWRARHDEVHAGQIRTWRDATKPPFSPGPRLLLLAALDAARGDLLRQMDYIPSDERDTRAVAGDWSLKDLVGHVTDWDLFALQAMQAMRKSRPLPVVDKTDQVNTRQVAVRREQTWSQVWAESQDVRAQLKDALKEWDDEQLAREMDYPFKWGRTAYGWIAMQVWHDREHADLLRALQAGATHEA